MPVTTYKLTATNRNKVFNYKQTVESTEPDEGQSLNDDIYLCNCDNLEFCDPIMATSSQEIYALLKSERYKNIHKGPQF